MPRYEVHVCRMGYGHATFKVIAKNKEEAEAFALEEAYNHVFSDNESEYSIEYVSKTTGGRIMFVEDYCVTRNVESYDSHNPRNNTRSFKVEGTVDGDGKKVEFDFLYFACNGITGSGCEVKEHYADTGEKVPYLVYEEILEFLDQFGFYDWKEGSVPTDEGVK